MEPIVETELEDFPEALFKLLSRAAVANGRTVEEEIVARLGESPDREETDQRKH